MDTVTIPGYLGPNSLLALMWTAFGVAALFTIFRTVIRIKLAGGLGIEDAWIYFALATLLTNTVLQTLQIPSAYLITAVSKGFIQPDANFMAQGDVYVKYEFAIIGLFWTVLWSVKASFLSVYYKLFAQLTLYRKLWYALAVFVFVVYVLCWVLSFNTCQPISDYFVFGKCTSPREAYLTRVNVIYSTSVDIGTDLMIMALPIRLIWGVKVTPKQKTGLVVIFGLCAIIIVFAIIRASQALSASGDVNLILLGLWSNLESSISVVVGCLPPFKMLLHKMSSQSAYSRGYQYNISTSRRSQRQNQPTRSSLRHSSVPLENFAVSRSNTKHIRTESSGESHEEMVDHVQQNITVKNDVTIEYTASPRDEEGRFKAFEA